MYNSQYMWLYSSVRNDLLELKKLLVGYLSLRIQQMYYIIINLIVFFNNRKILYKKNPVQFVNRIKMD